MPENTERTDLEYDIRVKLQENQKDIKDFDSIYINNLNGKLVRLKNVASVKETGPTQILERTDRALLQ